MPFLQFLQQITQTFWALDFLKLFWWVNMSAWTSRGQILALMPLSLRGVATSWNTVPAAPSASCHPPPIPKDDQLGAMIKLSSRLSCLLNTPTPQSLTFPTKFHGRTLNQWRWPLGEESTGVGVGDTPASPACDTVRPRIRASCPSRKLLLSRWP